MLLGTQYVLSYAWWPSALRVKQRDAEVINLVAFGEHLGALEFEDRADGTVQLVTQEFLKVPYSDQSLVFLTWTCCMTDEHVWCTETTRQCCAVTDTCMLSSHDALCMHHNAA